MITRVFAEKTLIDVGRLDTVSDSDESRLVGISPVTPDVRVELAGFDPTGDASVIRIRLAPRGLRESLCKNFNEPCVEIDRDEFVISDENGLDAFMQAVRAALQSLLQDSEEDRDFDADDDSSFDPSLDDTEVVRERKERVGQEIYRKRLERLWHGRCAVTGIDLPEVLRASHAKPWAECGTGAERLSPYNGLLLSANLDALFDKALITFDEKGRMVISPVITEENRHLLGLDRDFIIPLTEKHQPFMEWHRKMYQEALNQMKD